MMLCPSFEDRRGHPHRTQCDPHLQGHQNSCPETSVKCARLFYLLIWTNLKLKLVKVSVVPGLSHVQLRVVEGEQVQVLVIRVTNIAQQLQL